MMICEKCETELSTSIGACSACGHNPVLQRLDEWRDTRNKRLSGYKLESNSQEESPRPSVRNARMNAKDATLIRFPQRQSAAPTPEPIPASTEPVPVWKEQLNARLQEYREQREPAPKPAQSQHKFDRNPIIINALNRINKANYLQPITPPPHSRSSSAEELAPAPIAEVTPPVTTEITPIVSRLTAVSSPSNRLEPFVMEATPTVPMTDEDLLSEITFEPNPSTTTQEAKIEESHTAAHSTLESASLPKRFAAAVIDAEIIASSLLPLFGAYFFLSGWFEAPTIYIPILVSVLLITVYFFVTYALAGRTMGMAWCNLHLASLTTKKEQHDVSPTTTFTIKQAMMRALGGTITMLLFPLNVIVLARNDDRLSISDYLSDTQVVRIRK